ncbi:hypothetical protein AB1N83_013783 [Pleurotus pulmonarius]
MPSFSLTPLPTHRRRQHAPRLPHRLPRQRAQQLAPAPPISALERRRRCIPGDLSALVPTDHVLAERVTSTCVGPPAPEDGGVDEGIGGEQAPVSGDGLSR